MELSLKLRKELQEDKEKALAKLQMCMRQNATYEELFRFRLEYLAFSAAVEKVDFILNNSCVKPPVERSPTDEIQQVVVSRPTVEQNPQEEEINQSCSHRMIVRWGVLYCRICDYRPKR